jgi:hypothetical protein
VTDWTPATEAEAAMRDALAADDQELYFRILARVELLLPVSSEAIAGRAPMGWGTWTAGDRTHVLAFTSSEAMLACLAEHAGSARRIPYHELAAAWPNLDWWLAVNPGLPVEGYLPAWFVSQLARGDVRLPGRGGVVRSERAETLGRSRMAPPRLPAAPPGRREISAVAPDLAPPDAPPPEPLPAPPPAVPALKPANDLEQRLLAAASAGPGADSLLSIMLLAKVLLPVAEGADPAVRPDDDQFVWHTEKVDDQEIITAFTSMERLTAQLGGTVEPLAIRFVQLIRAWPDQSWSLVINPDTPIAVTLRGTQITALASSAAEVGLDDHAGEAWESGVAGAGRVVAAAVEVPPLLQKVIAPSQVVWYLERGYDRVSGFVHRAAEVAHLRTPAQLVHGLGLRYDGSPFTDAAEEIYVLRWPAFIPSLYRIPYGGRTEAAMTAMEGWVIERPPFRGNGFAPADSGDVIAEFKVDSVRLPHGAELWRLRADGSATMIGRLDCDGPTWVEVEES